MLVELLAIIRIKVLNDSLNSFIIINNKLI